MNRRKFIASAVTAAVYKQTRGWALAPDPSETTSPVSPVGEVRSEEIVIVYNSNSSAETVAAQELHKYLSRMTGGNPRLLKDQPPENVNSRTAVFLVGRTPAMARRISSGVIEEPHDKASEAYVVSSHGVQHGTEVLFLGGTGIATLYAVYHYLEQYCQVAFHQDGDHVPHRERVPASGVSIKAVPHFSERMTMNLTLYWYSAPWWDIHDWETYIDWTLKNRFNILSLWDTPGEDAVWKKVWKKHGVDIPDDSYSGPPYEIFAPIKYGVRPPLSAGWREEQSGLSRQVTRYARLRGMRTLAPAVPGIVPPEFVRIHPDAKTFELSWSGLPKQHYLDPRSSTYHEMGKAFLEEYNSLYGTDHLYWLENYLECYIHGTAENRNDVCRAIARSNFKVVDEVDSKGVGVLSAWTYLVNPALWTPELIREHLEGIPQDRVRILDQWAEMIPVYKKTDYFFGRPWHFGVLYSFAGDTNLHGNMAFIEKQFHDVVNDKQADQCIGFYPNPEAIGHNYFYYQFLAKLGWNPSETDLPRFVHDYAVVRYGEAVAGAMQGVLEELLASVYGSDDFAQPEYWHRLGPNHGSRFDVADRAAFIPHLRRALEKALQVKQLLQGNPFYLHDLNDIARQYLAELFNIHVRQLEISLGALDPATFEREAALLEKIMQAIETLLSHDDYYWLSPSIRKAQSLPGAPADVSLRARDILTLWAGVIRDYACRDCYELVQGYYRPRVRVYIQTMRKSLELRQRQLNLIGELDKQYTEIEEKWVKNGFPVIARRPDPRRVIETTQAILSTIPFKVTRA